MRAASLRRRLALSALVWVLLLAFLTALALSHAFRSAARRALDEQLAAEVRGLIAAIEVDSAGRWALMRSPNDPRFHDIYSGTYWQIEDAEGRIERSRSLWDAVLKPSQALGTSARTVALDTAGPRGDALRQVEQQVELPRLSGAVRVIVAEPRDLIDSEVATFDRMLAFSLGALGVGLVLAVWLQLNYGLRPLGRLATELRQLRRGEREGLSRHYPREIEPLVAELNAGLEQNQRLLQRARSQAADLAHALKTPLAVIRADAAAESGSFARSTESQVERMRVLVERHLSGAATAGAGRSRVPVAEVVSSLFDAMRRMHGPRELVLESAMADTLQFRGDREDLEELLGNLLDNACKWSHSRVRVTGRVGSGVLHLHIDDDGPGLPAEQRKEAARRGSRFDQQAPGHGLGLAIAGDIARSYGGSLELGVSGLGGLHVHLALPDAHQVDGNAS